MLLSRFSTFMAGELRLRFDLPPHTAAELFLLSGIPCYDQRICGGAYECRIERSDRRFLDALCRKRGLRYTILEERGFLIVLKRALRRPGLLFGIILALFLLWQAPCYVWDIEVYGNETLTREEVVQILADNGFTLGCRHTAIDLHLLCNAIPIRNEKIAWISVNMLGAVAEIRLVEMRSKPSEEKNGNPVNLVAGRAGRIVRYELSAGRAVVGVGQTVAPGQLLVAGYSEKESGLHPRASSGSVFAETLIEKSLFIPYEQTVKVEKERVLIEKRANILGKDVFFYKKGLQSGEKYDIVNDEYRPDVFSVALPFRVTDVYALPYEEKTVMLTLEEAKERAVTALTAELRSTCREVLRTEFIFREEEDGLHAYLRAYGIVDIAKRVEVIPGP